jgi:hypothetical protein
MNLSTETAEMEGFTTSSTEKIADTSFKNKCFIFDMGATKHYDSRASLSKFPSSLLLYNSGIMGTTVIRK